MSRIPDSPEEIFVPLIQDYLRVFAGELVSLIIYGSAAGGLYIKGKSDINLLVVLTPAGMDKLPQAFSLISQWKKRRVAVPLVLTKKFIAVSLDSYPIEFLNMKNSHILIYGENVLEKLEFQHDNLRLQIERELRGKLIHLRQGYLEAEGNGRKLRKLISASFTAFISIFNALLYLKKGSAPRGRRETIKEVTAVFAVDTEAFSNCASIKEGVDKFSRKEVEEIFGKYVREVENICNIVDAL